MGVEEAAAVEEAGPPVAMASSVWAPPGEEVPFYVRSGVLRAVWRSVCMGPGPWWARVARCVCDLVFLSRYMRPEGPWQRLRRCLSQRR